MRMRDVRTLANNFSNNEKVEEIAAKLNKFKSECINMYSKVYSTVNRLEKQMKELELALHHGKSSEEIEDFLYEISKTLAIAKYNADFKEIYTNFLETLSVSEYSDYMRGNISALSKAFDEELSFVEYDFPNLNDEQIKMINFRKNGVIVGCLNDFYKNSSSAFSEIDAVEQNFKDYFLVYRIDICRNKLGDCRTRFESASRKNEILAKKYRVIDKMLDEMYDIDNLLKQERSLRKEVEKNLSECRNIKEQVRDAIYRIQNKFNEQEREQENKQQSSKR